MVIKRLNLNNFGVYAGNNEFVFNNKKPIVLVGGMNGRGKTTFLEAVLLALYGSNSFAYSESKYRSYSQYLRSFINKSAQDKECGVELEFSINNGMEENYIVHRNWNGLTKKIDEQICVFKDGIRNEFLTQNWPMFVESILPSVLSSFFFFDGEKIAQMAVDNTNIQLKNAIRSMLGITVLDVLGNDILRNLKKVNKEDGENKTAEGVQKIRDAKEEALDELKKIDEKIEKFTHKIVEDSDKLEKLHQMYTAKGGDAVEKRQEIIQKRAVLMSELSVEENELYNLATRELPLLMVRDLIGDIKLQATDEHTDAVMREAVMKLDVILDEFIEAHSGDAKSCMDFVEYVKTQFSGDQQELVYELSNQALFQVNNLVETTLSEAKIQCKKILGNKKKLEKQIGELDSYLSLDVNDKELQDIYKKIKKAEQIVIDDQVKMSELEQRRRVANSKVISATSEFSKCVEAYIANAELRDSTDRIIKYSNMALSIIEKYQIELQKRKADLLAETITSCYKKLANKKNLIQKIEMDSNSLNMRYISEDGKEVAKDSLSAGEQQLMVISILWALAICSKKKLPVIIDTPLSRLDSLHRTALIQTYFPNAGEQTIILSTDSEIDNTYYQLMKDNVGDEFTLNYDENTKSTSIQKGYLVGVTL